MRQLPRRLLAIGLLVLLSGAWSMTYAGDAPAQDAVDAVQPPANETENDDSVEATKPGEPEVPPIEPAILESWVIQLDSELFAEREEASRKLIEAGAQGVPLLLKAAPTAGNEAGVRIVLILEQIYLQGASDQTIDAAEGALEQLKSVKNPTIANRADLLLHANYDVRERRAIAEIVRLGGVVSYNNLRNINPNAIGGVGVGLQIQHIVIGTKWKGGDEGLKHIKRLSQLNAIYYIKGAKVSPEALAELQKAMPLTAIQMRSPAYLGIAGGPHQRGCQIVAVTEESAAEQAGLFIGDVITHFEDKPVKDFDALIQEIAKKQPGDKVVMTVLRLADAVKIEVELGEWK
ncbi:MAG: PDZ domain-containing protein [Planctomycetaceae bacterium]